MGLISSGDEFCARSDRALADIPGVFKLVDDILIHGDAKNTVLLSQKINTNLDRLLNLLATSLTRKARR